MEKQKNAVGRRKEAVARVYMSKGTGNITVNEKEYKAYFPIMYLQNQVELPFKVTDTASSFDVVVNVQGGGPKGQAEAVKMAIARALCEVNNEAYRPLLKKEGLMTRDPRMVERKKFGKAKARRSFQFSKR
ncbi:MAG: 30S ribosomal protein S9 [Bacteroidetes bacterium 43-93]|jgi:small subunit ribosomal protein S9|nr:30S ribosomal protein S9 [Bacteroidota bacterium]OJW97805.1 MAG: 30S ribosomal protein S9 [Bacteroidetes bacterium 43-93]